MISPWNDPGNSISPLISEWQMLRSTLEVSFEKRDISSVAIPMQRGIELFLQMLFWTNEVPLGSLDNLFAQKLKYKPVNVEERLSFIRKRPNLYHSFIQLSELIVEQEKQFVRSNVLKKASKPNMG